MNDNSASRYVTFKSILVGVGVFAGIVLPAIAWYWNVATRQTAQTATIQALLDEHKRDDVHDGAVTDDELTIVLERLRRIEMLQDQLREQVFYMINRNPYPNEIPGTARKFP